MIFSQETLVRKIAHILCLVSYVLPLALCRTWYLVHNTTKKKKKRKIIVPGTWYEIRNESQMAEEESSGLRIGAVSPNWPEQFKSGSDAANRGDVLSAAPMFSRCLYKGVYSCTGDQTCGEAPRKCIRRCEHC